MRTSRRIPKPTGAVLAIAALIMVCGCSIGPTAVRANSLNYNDSVRSAVSEELLLNMVRIRYDDPTQWMSISSINSTFEAEIGAGGEGGVSGANVSGSGVASLRYRDAPTITFTPRQGEKLAKQMLTPVSVTNVGYLSNAGWPFRWVALILVENIQGIGSFDVSTHYPIRGQVEKFFRTLDLIDQLQRDDELLVGFLKYNDPWNDAPVGGSSVSAQSYIASAETGNVFVTDDGGETFDYASNDNEPMMMLRRRARESPEMKELSELLDLDESIDQYLFARARTLERPGKRRDYLALRTRSFSGVLRLLSHGVHVPDEHVTEKICARPIKGSVEAQIEHRLRRGFNIQVSDRRPRNAAVAVPYRGQWFFINDADASSKQTFMMLNDLFNLQISSGPSNSSPMLTIPVGI